MADGGTELEIAGHAVRITHPDKEFFSKRGETKLDLVQYYLTIAPQVMATMGGRPTLMQRFPDGASGKNFYQKRVPKGAPEWLRTTVVSTPNGTTSNAMVVEDLAHIAWAVNMGCLGFHPWPYQADNPAFVDELRIDLDPQPGVDFAQVREAAIETRDLLAEFQIQSYAKTSGSKGIHIYARLQARWDSYDVRLGVVAAARELERRRPDLVTAAWWKEERGPQVFVDFNQNAPHKTVFGAWSACARVGAQISAPVFWDQLPEITPDERTMPRVVADLESLGDPWAEINETPQDLSPLLELHRSDVEAGLPDAPWPPVYPKMPREPSRVAPSRAKAGPTS